jgi:curved DNA-binding protein CbpA
VSVSDAVPDFDLYSELEVAPTASTETIEAAYRSLARRNHPDVLSDRAGDPERMVRLNIAHEWLADPITRSLYDRDRRSTTRHPHAMADVEDTGATLDRAATPKPTTVYRCGACEDHGHPPERTAFAITTIPGEVSAHWCGARVLWTGDPARPMKTLSDPDDWLGYLVAAIWIGLPLLTLVVLGPGAAVLMLVGVTIFFFGLRWIRS